MLKKRVQILMVLLTGIGLAGCSNTNMSDNQAAAILEKQYSEETGNQEISGFIDEDTGSSNSDSVEIIDEDIGSEDSDLIDKVNEYKIEEQTFDVWLDDWGQVTFVSCMPIPDAGGYNPLTDVSFYLLSDKEVIYQFPYVNVRENNIRKNGKIDSPGVSFVMFMDVNGDEKDDAVIGILFCTGAGPQGVISRLEVRIYEDNGSEFLYNESLSNEITRFGLPYDTTAEDVKACLSK